MMKAFGLMGMLLLAGCGSAGEGSESVGTVNEAVQSASCNSVQGGGCTQLLQFNHIGNYVKTDWQANKVLYLPTNIPDRNTQLFTFESDGHGEYRIRDQNLNYLYTADGAHLSLTRSPGLSANALWGIMPQDGNYTEIPSGPFRIQNASNYQCMTEPSAMIWTVPPSTGRQNEVQLGSCASSNDAHTLLLFQFL